MVDHLERRRAGRATPGPPRRRPPSAPAQLADDPELAQLLGQRSAAPRRTRAPRRAGFNCSIRATVGRRSRICRRTRDSASYSAIGATRRGGSRSANSSARRSNGSLAAVGEWSDVASGRRIGRGRSSRPPSKACSLSRASLEPFDGADVRLARGGGLDAEQRRRPRGCSAPRSGGGRAPRGRPARGRRGPRGAGPSTSPRSAAWLGEVRSPMSSAICSELASIGSARAEAGPRGRRPASAPRGAGDGLR